MAKHIITLIPGDGIGPEIVAATVRIIEASGVEIEWETQIIGAQALEKFGTTLPETATDSIKKNKVAPNRERLQKPRRFRRYLLPARVPNRQLVRRTNQK